MSTITREQAKDLRNAFQCWQQDYDPVEDKEQYDMFGLGVVAMDSLLASLEAVPVGTFKKGPCGYHPSFHEDAVPLYTAPPAPVYVPAAMEMDDDFDSSFEHGKAVGWNACRAAMLQSFGNSEQLNSPVIPDGWVACSERMPETMVSVLVTGTWFHHAVAFWDGLSWCDLDFEPPVTHWMPLPAAPQQE